MPKILTFSDEFSSKKDLFFWKAPDIHVGFLIVQSHKLRRIASVTVKIKLTAARKKKSFLEEKLVSAVFRIPGAV